MYRRALAEHGNKVPRLHYANDLVSEYVGSKAQIEYFQSRTVYLLYLKLFIENNQSVRRIAHDCIGEVLGFVLEIGKTHRNFGFSVEDGDCFFATGIISA